MTNLPPIVIIHGPTASGKSALAVNVAKESDAVIINADSMQVYKEIPIITAQPTKEEQQGIEHHLYGHISITNHFSVSHWLKEVVPLIKHIRANNKIPLLVGGTGLYIKSLIEGISTIPDIPAQVRQDTQELYNSIGAEAFHNKLREKDPEIAERLPSGDTQRILRAYEVAIHTGTPLSAWQQQEPTRYFDRNEIKGYFLHPEREAVYENCNKRFLEMINNNLLNEIKQLHKLNPPQNLPAMKALGIPDLIAYIEGKQSLDEAITNAQTQTRRYVKRQLTWQRNQFPDFSILEKPDAELILPLK